jgi:membrane-bound lytic murein transglycosylase A
MQPRLKIHARLTRACAVLFCACAAACSTAPPVKPPSQVAAPPVKAPAAPAQSAAQPAAPTQQPAAAAPAPAPTPAVEGAAVRPATWTDLPGWRDDELVEAWPAFIASCGVLGAREAWREACAAAARLAAPTAETIRLFFERSFRPWQVTSSDGADDGLVTGYYEPLLRGSRKPTARYRFPLYAAPDDLLTIDVGDAYPELKGTNLRGRVEGRRVVPYYDRAQIEAGLPALRGKEIAWVDDRIDLFFLQVQGSGRIALESGETLRVGYADHNGYPYRSIGRVLVERGELALERASMQGIKAWARERPDQLTALLNSNARYVFFREVAGTAGPSGALGVPLTARRSVAVDPRYVPLGAPVFLATTWPNTARPLNRLVLAQDTGGAIRGAVRADFFWGYGDAAAREAGRMKQRLRMWVLLPNGFPVPGAN